MLVERPRTQNEQQQQMHRISSQHTQITTTETPKRGDLLWSREEMEMEEEEEEDG